MGSALQNGKKRVSVQMPSQSCVEVAVENECTSQEVHGSRLIFHCGDLTQPGKQTRGLILTVGLPKGPHWLGN